MSRLSRLIRAVELLPSASREIKSFSTGMITRLGLAAALMNDPELLILDEPTSGLDPSGRKSTLDLMKELGKEKTIFVSSHILSDIERICTHVGIVNDGKVIYSGSIKEMKKFTMNNVLRLEVDGNIELLCEKLRSVTGITELEKRGDFIIDITFNPDIPRIDIIQKVINLVPQCNSELISINSSTSTIEDAFLKLLEEEESSGFLRAIKS
jgi:ABC-type multidrug transport system ATPase subunit